jgi:hypothetical protein
VLTALLVAFGAAVVAAGQREPDPPPLPGVERLGPEPGEPIARYLARAAVSLPARGTGPAWALVQLEDHLDAATAAALTQDVATQDVATQDVATRDVALAQDVRISRVVLRVPLPRVQTALLTRPVPGQRPAGEIAAAMRSTAGDRQAVAAPATAGRAGEVAAAEARRLREGCACVVALLVRGDRAALERLATRSHVRAVHAARVGTPPQGLALAPLLPEQREAAGPVPDDGPVP